MSDKYTWEDEEITPVGICAQCIHFHGNFCDAYPRGIPTDILLGNIDHRKPVDGDHGIQFEAKEASNA